MWEAIAKILTNSNALLVLVFMSMFVAILIILASTGLVRIDTGAFQMGADHRERDIIRQQVEWAHSYVMGLESRVHADNSKFGGYKTKYILELCSNEITNWIAFNHINLESDYVSIKQEKIKSIIRTFDVDPEFTSKPFERQVDQWVEEIIRKLVKIREVYK